MPILIILAVLLILAGPVALVISMVLLSRFQGVSRELDHLRGEVQRLRADGLGRDQASPVTAPVLERATAEDVAPIGRSETSYDRIAPSSESPDSTVRSPALPLAGTRVPSHRSNAGMDFETVIGSQWLTWIGVIAILFGTAFFLAIDLGEHQLAGRGQVGIGLAVALAFLGIGALLERRARRFLGLGLLGGGIGLLFLASFASIAFHRLAPPIAAYPFLAITAAAGALLALRTNSATVAGLTLVGAFLTPFLLELRAPRSLVLFPYLFAVDAGAAWIAARRTWRALPLGAFLGTVIIVAYWWNEHPEPRLRTGALAGVAALWLVFGVASLVRPGGARFWSAARGVIVFANAIALVTFLFNWLSPGQESLRGAVTAGLALVYLLAARVLARIDGRRKDATTGSSGPRSAATVLHGESHGWDVRPARALHYTGLLVTALAIPIQLDLASVTLGWALLGFFVFEHGLRSGDRAHRLIGLGTLAAGLGHGLIVQGIALDGQEVFRNVVNATFLSGTLLTAVLGLTAFRIVRASAQLGGTEQRLATPIVLAAAMMFFFVLSVETLRSFDLLEMRRGNSPSTELGSALSLTLVWTIYAALLVGGGVRFKFRPIRLLGFLVLLLAVGKLFLVDVEGLERGYRIAAFVGVGALLLVISVLYQRGKRESASD